MANEKVLGLVSGTRDGKLLVVTTPTRCDDPASGEVYMGLVSGTRNGKPLVAFSTQRCDPDDELTDGQTYLGLVSGTRDGKPLLVVPCGNCEPPPECPDCSPCSDATVYPEELTATVDIACFPGTFTVTLTRDTGLYPDSMTCGDAAPSEPGDEEVIAIWTGTATTGPGSGGTFTATNCYDFTGLSITSSESSSCTVSLTLSRSVDTDGCWVQVWSIYFEAVQQASGVIYDASGIGTYPIAEGCTLKTTINSCEPLDISSYGNTVCYLPVDPCPEGTSVYEQCAGTAWTVEITE